MDSIVNLLRENHSVVEIARRLGVHRNAIYTSLHLMGIEDIREFRRSVKFNQYFFNQINTEEKAYWFGFLCADGCVYIKNPIYRVQIHLGGVDIGHLRKWHKSIGSCQNVTKCGGMVNSAHHSQRMCNDLIAHGCVTRKSLVLKFPIIRNDLMRHFIRGYFDGDGSIYWHQNRGQSRGGMRLSIVGTRRFLGSLQSELNRSLGIKRKKLSSRPDHHLTFQLVIGVYREARRVAGWMYNGASVFLDRKRLRYVEFCRKMEK